MEPGVPVDLTVCCHNYSHILSKSRAGEQTASVCWEDAPLQSDLLCFVVLTTAGESHLFGVLVFFLSLSLSLSFSSLSACIIADRIRDREKLLIVCDGASI